mmetsp:Transcript_113318/g.325784  ORF Transcript_113318/g.325784 Transcript_113318/m.325784 type:complete len:281 (-) Transcript_113318:1149-1991(-)
MWSADIARKRSFFVLSSIAAMRFCRDFMRVSSSASFAFAESGADGPCVARLSAVVARICFDLSVTSMSSTTSSSPSSAPSASIVSSRSTSACTFCKFSSLPSQASLARSSLSAVAQAFLVAATSRCAAAKRACSWAKAAVRPPFCFASRAFSAMACLATSMEDSTSLVALVACSPMARSSTNGLSGPASANGLAAATSSFTLSSQAFTAASAAPTLPAYFFSKVDDATSSSFFAALFKRSAWVSSRFAADLAASGAANFASVRCFLTVALAWAMIASTVL